MVISFVDESRLPKASDNITPIRGGSVGINEILGLFKNGVTTHKNNQWNTYLVNAFTLFRNVYNSKLKEKELEELFMTEYEIFLSYLTSYLSYFPNTRKSIIVLFFPRYTVPTVVQKQPSKQYTDIYTAYYKLYKKHNTLFEVFSNNEYMYQLVLDAGSSFNLPYVSVVKAIKKIANDMKDVFVYPSDKIFLLTNCLLDLYIYKHYVNVELVECYTAKIKTYKHFGTKLTDQVEVPFIWETHRLFGDKYHIEPLVRRNTKKLIIEQATKNKWIFKNINFITNDIVKTLGCDKSVFSMFKP